MSKRIKVYMACPYSHEDLTVRERRYNQANRGTAYLMNKGYVVFSPITHSHPVDTYLGQQDHGFWLEQDAYFIRWADELWILTLDGWEESFGVTWERGFAVGQGMQIHLLDYTNVEAWLERKAAAREYL